MDGNQADLERRIKNTDPDSCSRIAHAVAVEENHLRERPWSSEERDLRRKSGGRAFLSRQFGGGLANLASVFYSIPHEA